MADFLTVLQSDQVLLMDGAMGTELHRAGITQDECHESWNLSRPEQVRAIHARYASAGSQCLVTNTFQSNPASLARHNRQSQLAEINRHGVALARAAGGPDRFVLGSIGPFFLNRADLAEIVASLQEADGLLLETWSGPEAFAATRLACDVDINPRRLPVLLSFTFRPDPPSQQEAVLHEGLLTPAGVAALAAATGCAGLGVNCGKDIDLQTMAAILLAYRTATALPLFARPNAGTPTRLGDAWVYPQTPASMAAELRGLLAAGATMVGGCCGTTPETTAAFSEVIHRGPVRR